MTASIEEALMGNSCEDDIIRSKTILGAKPPEENYRPIYGLLSSILQTSQLSAKADLRRAKEKLSIL